jgi:hypothetical protein
MEVTEARQRAVDISGIIYENISPLMYAEI